MGRDMKNTQREMKTLTEAARGSRVTFVRRSSNDSNARAVPYVDLYRASTGILETPAERLQRVSREDREPIENG